MATQLGDRGEEAALLYAQENATPGDPDSIIAALDRFAWNNHWMMFVGDEKGKLLDDEVSKLPDGARVLELGTFMGYSAVRIGRLLGNAGRLFSVEPDERRARLAQQLVDMAGLHAKVQILAADSTSAIHKLAQEPNPALDLVFLDHIKDMYLQDAQLLETSGCLKNGSVFVADNTPECPDYIEFVRDCGRYDTRSHEADLAYTSPSKDSANCPHEHNRRPQGSGEQAGRIVDGVEISIYRPDGVGPSSRM